MRIALTALLAGISSVAADQSCPVGSVPPLDPSTNETYVVKNDFLAGRCPPIALQRFAFKDLLPGKVSFSRSDEWGEVVRYDVGNAEKPNYGRFVCFKKPGESKVHTVLYDLKTGACFNPEHSGYFTIYPPLSDQR